MEDETKLIPKTFFWMFLGLLRYSNYCVVHIFIRIVFKNNS